MATFRRFEEIVAWQRAKQLASEIHRITSRRSFSRDRALQNQIRRAAISAMSNIAEGFERDGRREFVQFLAVAKGSVGEARSQPYLARDWGLLGEAEFETLHRLADETSRTISGLINYLQSSSVKGRKFDRNF